MTVILQWVSWNFQATIWCELVQIFLSTSTLIRLTFTLCLFQFALIWIFGKNEEQLPQNNCWSSVGQLSADKFTDNCRPTGGQQLADKQWSVGHLLVSCQFGNAVQHGLLCLIYYVKSFFKKKCEKKCCFFLKLLGTKDFFVLTRISPIFRGISLAIK